jgi:hypothetical protein
MACNRPSELFYIDINQKDYLYYNNNNNKNKNNKNMEPNSKKNQFEAHHFFLVRFRRIPEMNSEIWIIPFLVYFINSLEFIEFSMPLNFQQINNFY